jgi:hypothetical protein
MTISKGAFVGVARGLVGGMIAATLAAGSPALAVVAYDEAVSGDLSGTRTSPTPISLVLGENKISGSVGAPGGVVDRDYFTFTLSAGQQLTAIQVLTGTTSVGPRSLSFFGLQSGGQVTVDPAAASATDLLGYAHYGPGLIGTDILDDISIGAGSHGFTPPLGAGTYSVWLQEVNDGTANYRFNFLVAPVPEPSSWAMMLVGFGLIGATVRRRRSQIVSGPNSARSLAM